jgi:glyoxylase-like metal-dependent hydrolase (beta-lactamase superfamily II)/rhodanese-related sulfurtransferase
MAQIETYYLGCLAQASYLVHHDGVGILIDPRRDAALYLDHLAQLNVRLKGIVLTHLHADFVAGHTDVAAATGAPVFMGRKCDARSPHCPVIEGDRLHLSEGVSLEAVETPGHTPGCVSWKLIEQGIATRIFTGDTLFVGSVGRPDLLGSLGVGKEDLAMMMYDTINNKLKGLPDACIVHPGHGPGSPCGKMLSDNLTSTIGEEKATNQAFTLTDKTAFLAFLTEGQPVAPSYFLGCVSLNKTGPPAIDSSGGAFKALPLLSIDEFQQRSDQLGNDAGVFKLDTREAADFAAGHLDGFLNFPMGIHGGVDTLTPDKLDDHEGNFSIWVGTIVPPNAKMLLITPIGREREAFVRLARIGMCKAVEGILQGGLDAAAAHQRGIAVRSHDRVPAARLCEAQQQEGRIVIDVRTRGEFVCKKNGHFAGSYSAPLCELQTAVDELRSRFPGKAFVTYCRGGFRSAVAASILKRAGFEASDVVGGYPAVRAAWPDLVGKLDVEGFLVDASHF